MSEQIELLKPRSKYNKIIMLKYSVPFLAVLAVFLGQQLINYLIFGEQKPSTGLLMMFALLIIFLALSIRKINKYFQKKFEDEIAKLNIIKSNTEAEIGQKKYNEKYNNTVEKIQKKQFPNINPIFVFGSLLFLIAIWVPLVWAPDYIKQLTKSNLLTIVIMIPLVVISTILTKIISQLGKKYYFESSKKKSVINSLNSNT